MAGIQVNKDVVIFFVTLVLVLTLPLFTGEGLYYYAIGLLLFAFYALTFYSREGLYKKLASLGLASYIAACLALIFIKAVRPFTVSILVIVTIIALVTFTLYKILVKVKL